jgi:hypothetical protein
MRQLCFAWARGLMAFGAMPLTVLVGFEVLVHSGRSRDGSSLSARVAQVLVLLRLLAGLCASSSRRRALRCL